LELLWVWRTLPRRCSIRPRKPRCTKGTASTCGSYSLCKSVV
jgi:hypothetical protein